MINNFFVIALTLDKSPIYFFNNFYEAYYYCTYKQDYCDFEIWHCSKYLDECIRLTTIKNKYYEF